MPDQIQSVSPVSALINKIQEIITRFIASKPPFLRCLTVAAFSLSSVPKILCLKLLPVDWSAFRMMALLEMGCK